MYGESRNRHANEWLILFAIVTASFLIITVSGILLNSISHRAEVIGMEAQEAVTYGPVETSLGRLIELNLYSRYTELDSQIDSEVSSMFAEMFPGFSHSVEILTIDSMEVNAYALPAGRLVITSGLLQFVENSEELALVMAHEAGHISAGHVMKQVRRSAGLALIINIVSGGNSSAITEILNNLITSGYSRKMEYQADDYAVNWAVSRGISPEHLANFLQRISTRTAEVPEILSSHPNPGRRIERIQNNAFETIGQPDLQLPELSAIQQHL